MIPAISILVLISAAPISASEGRTEPAGTPPAKWSTSEAPEAKLDGYQQARWGMTFKQVQKLYPVSAKGDHPEPGDAQLLTKLKVGGKDAIGSFYFAGDRLFSVGIVLTAQHLNPNEYIQAYTSMKEGLTRRYGTPASDAEDWTSSVYEKSGIGLAVGLAAGQVELKATWVLEKTMIRLSANSGEVGKVAIVLMYASTAMEGIFRQAVEKHEEEGL